MDTIIKMDTRVESNVTHPDATPKLTGYNVADEFKPYDLDEIREIAVSRQLPYAVALANITGDLNTGVIIRSACVLGAERVFIFGRKKYDRRSTVGAHHYIDISHFESADTEDIFDWSVALHTIRVNGYTPVLIEQGGKSLTTFRLADIPAPICLVFGAEDVGIPSNICAHELCFSIPQPGVLRSLNVSSAASIAMWQVVSEFLRS